MLKIREDILDRMTGVEMVLHALFLAKGNTDIALALTPRMQKSINDNRKMRGRPDDYTIIIKASRGEAENFRIARHGKLRPKSNRSSAPFPVSIKAASILSQPER